MTDLRVTVDGVGMLASWTDDNPETREALVDALPVAGAANRWGDELYFRIPVDVPTENTTTEVPVGGIAYWPEGNSLCLFWGPTPLSQNGEPRAAAPVNVVAQLMNADPLSRTDSGSHVEVELR